MLILLKPRKGKGNQTAEDSLARGNNPHLIRYIKKKKKKVLHFSKAALHMSEHKLVKSKFQLKAPRVI